MRILTLIIVLFLAIDMPTTQLKQVETYDILAAEGVVAVVTILNMDKSSPSPSPLPETKTCECDGTGVIKPDGVVTIPCPCGTNCKCLKKTLDTIKQEKTKSIKQIYYFTGKYCLPCRAFDRDQTPDLIAKGWGVNDNEKSYIRKLDVEQYKDLYNKYGQDRGIPLFILIEDGKEIDAIVGYDSVKKMPSSLDIANMFYKER